MRYFYTESMISLELCRCGLLAKAIAYSWPVGAGGVGTQPWVPREGWRKIGRDVCLCACSYSTVQEGGGTWWKGVGGRGEGGGRGMVDARILLAMPRKRFCVGGWECVRTRGCVWMRRERKQTGKFKRENKDTETWLQWSGTLSHKKTRSYILTSLFVCGLH